MMAEITQTRMGSTSDEGVADLAGRLRALRDEVRRSLGDDGPSGGDPSIDNMRAYLTLRGHDIRDLQDALARLGLSSLGRSVSHVLATIEQVLGLLEKLGPDLGRTPAFDEGDTILRRRTQALFGSGRRDRQTRIMVTLPAEAAADPDLVRSLRVAGMDCARINSAHDDEATWARMASHVRDASAAEGLRVPILVDLPGPKLRTGAIEPGPEVAHLKPRHDELGAVVGPARAWLTGDGGSAPAPPGASAVLSVPPAWLRALSEGDAVRFTDARGRSRSLRVGAGGADGRWVEADRGAYLVSGQALAADSAGPTHLGLLPPRRSHIPLAVGDAIVLTRDQTPGRRATSLSPARIPCTLPEAFETIAIGHAVWLDDGKFGGVVRSATTDEVELEVTHAPPGGGKLRAEKGINLPDTRLRIDTLAGDASMIRFAAAHADMVGLSFVSSPDDVRAVASALSEVGGDDLGLILKIETQAAFTALPALLTEALTRGAPCGVMIARGDLAIEVGWERMAEVQDEILWLCEAAHVPVIWATQVLDTLARTGVASRAEITDAAYGARADCVMLNKGPMIVAAIATLNEILSRMATHHNKKSSLLRRLRTWTPE
jgi:pyruvate kinase